MADRLPDVAARAAAFEPLSHENRAALSELIGDAARPAPADFLLRMGHTVKDCRTHDHGTGEDFFCGNLTGWMGERMALVMRRLLDAEAELARYVGAEPTVAEEMQYLNRCLDAVHDVLDEARRGAERWENPLPVPEWVTVVAQAANGRRPTRRPSRAEVLREAADVADSDNTCDCGGCVSCVRRQIAAELRRMADAAGKDTRKGESTPAAAPDFFQPGHTYTGDYGWKFRVDSITTHPEDGARTALGWRFFNGQWEPMAYEEGDWKLQQALDHIVSTDGGDAG
ncbi:hypothetical protein [Streptomyces sioyaensis]|uniref:hypothetical protein n=1 Tax=Streptomyces sioyaensis TaxID=67364 RepID=UPI003D73246D